MSMHSFSSETDEELFASLSGGQSVIEWFGFCPDFHDSTLERLELFDGDAVLILRICRITDEIDANGYYVTDRHASVTLRMRGVTGVRLRGDAAASIIFDLLIRRLRADLPRHDRQSFAGPVRGDIEITFGASAGLCASIFAKELAFELRPDPAPRCGG